MAAGAVADLGVRPSPALASDHVCTGVEDRNLPIFDFTQACARHDKCYETLGRSQRACDEQFRRDMVAWCQRTHRGRGTVRKLNLERCFRVAGTYYKGVRVGGRRAYDKAQAEARAAARFKFAVPAQLPDPVLGAEYRYWFCQPPPPNVFCGRGYKTTNPSGGDPPYVFGVPGVVPTVPGSPYLIPVPGMGIALNVYSGEFYGYVGALSAAGTYRFTICASDAGPAPEICRETQLVIKAPPVTGTYTGTITWTWGPPIVSISPNPEPISFTVRDGAISGDLVGTVDGAGNASVRVTTFGSRGQISGTISFSSSGGSVRVSGTVSGTLSTAGGVGRVSGRVQAERS